VDRDYIEAMQYGFDLAKEAVRPGAELFWFASDSSGHVGVFSTAGFGMVPKQILSDWEKFLRIFCYFSFERKESSDGVILETALAEEPEDELAEWLEYARKGLYAFDSPSHMTSQYERLARPNQAAFVADLPEDARDYLRRMSLSGVNFTEATTVDVRDQYDCA